LLAHWLVVLVLVVLVLVVVILSGCQRDKPPVPEQPFKIGVVFPFSGNDCATGLDLQSGVELALEIVNQEYGLYLPLAPDKDLTRPGGIGLQAIYRDASYDPVKAARSAEELFINAKVKVLIDGYTCWQNLLGGGYLVKIQHGEGQMVWPRDVATSRVIWPISSHQALEAQP
jgi:hypothetical protein